MKTLARNKNNDLYLSAGGIAEVSDLEAYRDIITALILTQLGEMQFDSEGGIDYFGTVFQNPTYLELWAGEVQNRVSELEFVSSIDDFTYDFDRETSGLSWTMTVITTDGRSFQVESPRKLEEGNSEFALDWNGVVGKPLGMDNALDTVEAMRVAVKKLETAGIPNSLQGAKDILNYVLLRANGVRDADTSDDIVLKLSSVPANKEYSLSPLHVIASAPFVVDWGDGDYDFIRHDATIESYPTHRYSKGGDYTVTLAGQITGIESVAEDLSSSDSTDETESLICGSSCLYSLSVGKSCKLNSIGNHTFDGCSSLSQVSILSNVTSLGEFCFHGTAIKDLDWFPSSVSQIGTGCFRGCAALASIGGLSSAIKTIPLKCFENCTAIAYLAIPQNVASIGNYAFNGCSSLKEVYIPSLVTSIGTNAFTGCPYISKVRIDAENAPSYSSMFNTVVKTNARLYVKAGSVSSYASTWGFSTDNIYCWGDMEFQFSDGIPMVKDGTGTFTSECPWFVDYGDGTRTVLFSKDKAIPSHTYADATSSTIVKISGFITEMSANSASSCPVISCDENNVNTKLTGFSCAFDSSKGPASLLIGDYSFCNCFSLSSVSITANAVSFGVRAFWKCESLTNLSWLPESLVGMGEYCFGYCTSLVNSSSSPTVLEKFKDIEGVSVLPAWCFIGCSSMTDLSGIGEIVGGEYKGISAISEGCFSLTGITSLSALQNATDINSLPSSCFKGCEGLLTVSSADLANISTIGSSCFEDCTGMTGFVASLNIGAGDSSDSSDDEPITLTTIGERAFASCTSLVTISAFADFQDLTEISSYCFDGCTSLSDLSSLSNIITIGEGAFRNCTDIDSLSGLISVVTINAYAFDGCSSLKRIDGLGPNVQNMWNCAFRGCPIEKVVLTTLVPPTTNGAAFYGIDYATVPVYVRESALSDYKDSSLWTKFSNIYGQSMYVGISSVSVGDVLSGCTISSTDITAGSGIWYFHGDGNYEFINGSVSNGTRSVVLDPYTYGVASSDAITCEVFGDIGMIDSTAGSSCFSTSGSGLVSVSNVGETNLTCIGKNAFKDNTSLESISLLFSPVTVDYGSSDSGSDSDGQEANIIDRNAFMGCVNLSSIVLSGGDLELRNQAFANCSSLESLGEMFNVTVIGDKCFYNARLKETHGLGLRIYSIGNRAFAGNMIESVSLYPINPPLIETQSFSCGSQVLCNGEMGLTWETINKGVPHKSKNGEYIQYIQEDAYCALVKVNDDTCVELTFTGEVVFNDVGDEAPSSHVVGDYYHVANGIVLYTSSSDSVTIDETSEIIPCTNGAWMFNKDLQNTSYTALVTDNFENLSNNIVYFDSSSHLPQDFVETDDPMSSIIGAYMILDNAIDNGDASDSDSDDDSNKIPLYVPANLVSTYDADDSWNAWTKATPRSIKFSIGNISYEGLSIIEADDRVHSEFPWVVDWGDGTREIYSSSVSKLPSHDFSDENVSYDIYLSGIVSEIHGTEAQNLPFITDGNDQFNYLLSCHIDSSVMMATIGTDAFAHCASMTTVLMDDEAASNITSIGDFAFYGCSSLSTIPQMKNISQIGVSSFQDCTSLSSVGGMETLTAIPQNAFKGDTALASVPDFLYVSTIGSGAFYGCSSLESINDFKNVTSIGDSAFYGCSNVKAIPLFKSLVSVGANAFASCSSIGEVVLPRTLETIGASAFEDCSSLLYLFIDVNVVSIGKGCFEGCPLTVVESNPFTPPTIDEETFSEDSYNNAVLYVDDNCIDEYSEATGWKNFKSILGASTMGCLYIDIDNIPSSGISFTTGSTETGTFKFNNLGALRINWGDGSAIQVLTGATEYAMPNYFYDGKKSSVQIAIIGSMYEISGPFIPENIRPLVTKLEYDGKMLTNLKTGAFSDLVYINSIVGFNGLTDTGIGIEHYSGGEVTGNMPFTNSALLETVDGFNSLYTFHRYAIGFGLRVKTLRGFEKVYRMGNEAFKDMTLLSEIPQFSSVGEIRAKAFKNCTSLKEFNSCPHVTIIGEEAFMGCTSLETIGSLSHIVTIGASAFEGCTALKSMEWIGENVTSIGKRAFRRCNSLTEVRMNASTPPAIWYGENINLGSSSSSDDNFDPEIFALLDTDPDNTFSSSATESTGSEEINQYGTVSRWIQYNKTGMEGEGEIGIPLVVNNMTALEAYSSEENLGWYRFVQRFYSNLAFDYNAGTVQTLPLTYSLPKIGYSSSSSKGRSFSCKVGNNTYMLWFLEEPVSANGGSGGNSFNDTLIAKISYDGGETEEYATIKGTTSGSTFYLYSYTSSGSGSTRTLIGTLDEISGGTYFLSNDTVRPIYLAVKRSDGNNLDISTIPYTEEWEEITATGTGHATAVRPKNLVVTLSDNHTETIPFSGDNGILENGQSFTHAFSMTATNPLTVSYIKADGIDFPALSGECPSKGGLIGVHFFVGGPTAVPSEYFRAAGNLVDVTGTEYLISIGNYAFAECKKISGTISLLRLTSIGEGAFYYCTSLERVVEVNAMSSGIPKFAFNNCYALLEVSGEKIFNPGMSSFAVCDNLEKIELSALTTSIGDRAFYGCKKLVDIRGGGFPNLTTIEVAAFQYCYALKEFTAGDNVSFIGNGAFNLCKSLETVSIGGTSDMTLGSNIFSSLGNLKSVSGFKRAKYIPGGFCNNDGNLVEVKGFDNAEVVYDGAFTRCRNLNSISLPSVKTISNDVFLECESLPSIGDCQLLTTIGHNAFRSCTSFNVSKSFAPNLVSIGNDAFRMCLALDTIPEWNSVTSIGSCAFRSCTSITTINGFNALLSLGNEAFMDSMNISGTVTMGSGVGISYVAEDTYCGKFIFTGCNKITGLVGFNFIHGVLPIFSNVSDVWLTNNSRGFTRMPYSLTLLSGFNNIDTIPSNAFDGSDIETIRGFKSVKTIEECAFRRCAQLKDIPTFDNVEDITTQNSAFLILGDYPGIFSLCTSLQKLPDNFMPKIPYVQYDMFEGCSSLKTINPTHFKSANEIHPYAFRDCVSLDFTSIECFNSITSVGKRAFHGCTSLSLLPKFSNVTFLGVEAFSKCTSLQEVREYSLNAVESASSLEYDGSFWETNKGHQFYGCESLQSIKGLRHLKRTSVAMFQGCKSLTDISGLANVDYLNDFVFAGCVMLKNARHEDLVFTKITHVGRRAFYNCTGLVSTAGLGKDLASFCEDSWEGCKFSYLQLEATNPPQIFAGYSSDVWVNASNRYLTHWVLYYTVFYNRNNSNPIDNIDLSQLKKTGKESSTKPSKLSWTEYSTSDNGETFTAIYYLWREEVIIGNQTNQRLFLYVPSTSYNKYLNSPDFEYFSKGGWYFGGQITGGTIASGLKIPWPPSGT